MLGRSELRPKIFASLLFYNNWTFSVKKQLPGDQDALDFIVLGNEAALVLLFVGQ